MSILNPLTGNYIKESSTVGKAIKIIESLSYDEIELKLKQCSSSLVLNPVTNKCISATTRDGKSIFSIYEFYLSNQTSQVKIKKSTKKKLSCQDYPEKKSKFIPREHQLETLEQFKKYFDETRGILLYWGLGMGKSCGADILLDYCLSLDPDKNVYILTTAGTRDNFKKQYCSVCGNDDIDRFTFIAYNYSMLYEKLDEIKFIDNAIVIIDEFHNLSSGYINEGVNYAKLFKLLSEATNTKFILMSGTPLQDRIKEVYIILNLLLPQEYNNYEKFKEDFIPNNQGQLIPPNYLKSSFTKIISNYHNSVQTSSVRPIKDRTDTNDFPRVNDLKITIPMSKYQYENYLLERSKELAVIKPDKKMMIENPKRYDSMKTKYFLAKIMYGSIGECNCSYPEYAKDMDDKDIINEEFISNILKYSPKLYFLIESIYKYQAKHIIFTRYVKKHGVELIAATLRFFNVPHLIFSGETGSDEKRQDIIDKFNSEDNINGENYRVLIFTRAGSEGLNLFQVRFFYAFEQYIRTYLIYQAEGRAIRLGSHLLLPEDMRDITSIKLFAVTPGDNIKFDNVEESRKTSDFYAYEEAQKKRFKILPIIEELDSI